MEENCSPNGEESLPVAEASVEVLLNKAKTIKERSENSPESVVSDIPVLIEMLRSTEFGKSDVPLRHIVLRTLLTVAEHDPTLIEDEYPEIIEATLDTTEGRVIARSLLPQAAKNVRLGVTPRNIAGGIVQGCSEAVSEIDTLSERVTESRGVDQKVPSGGSTAIHLYEHLMEYSDLVGGREQLLVEECASAAKELAAYQVKKAGLDPIDGIVELQSYYQDSDQLFTSGFNRDGELVDTIESGGVSQFRTRRYFTDGMLGAAIIVLVEHTEPQILRTGAIIAEQIK